MRPVRLEVEGLTSFREKAVLDFDGLDLFAITGPTGAGKSSLIDALTFALFGQVPRVGREYKQLIAHGAERLSVSFEFEVGTQRYRVARTVRVRGAAQVRLEKVGPDGPEPLADRAAEVEAQVQRIVGLDYDAFTRAVVLPQGQFDAFLKGKPEERRKILVALLSLEVYERMQKAANLRAADARREAEFIARQLEHDFAGSTPEALAGREGELAGARAEKKRLDAALGALAGGLTAARRVRAARESQAQLEREAGDEQRRLGEAEQAVAAVASLRADLEKRAADLAGRLQRTGFDAERLTRVETGLPRVEQWARLAPRLAATLQAAEDARQRLAQRRQSLAEAEATATQRQAAEVQARERHELARAAHEQGRNRHAAHALRPSLREGEPCPVCEQEVRALPTTPAPPALEGLRAAETAAERAAAEAQRAAAEASLALERLRAELAGLERELAERERSRREAQDEATAARAGLLDAGFPAADLEAPAPLLDKLQRERAVLVRAREAHKDLEDEARQVESKRAGLAERAAAATATAGAARARCDELAQRREQEREALETEQRGLLELAATRGWELPPDPRPGRDEVTAIEALEGRQRQAQSAVTAQAARLETEIEQLRQRLARAAELRAERETLEARAALAGTLAQHLRADQFIAFVQEEALGLLAQDGSRHLETLSQGRYALVCHEQEFSVLDRWNGDSERSVRTLSGGESFLASLALALALAESLARLSAQGSAAETLDSLFLDEGFGSLDAETLDVAVQALDALQGGRRTVGVVTHIQELAERLPARVEVRRGENGATLRVL